MPLSIAVHNVLENTIFHIYKSKSSSSPWYPGTPFSTSEESSIQTSSGQHLEDKYEFYSTKDDSNKILIFYA